MDRKVNSLFAIAAQWFRPRYNAKFQLLEAQIRLLRARIDTNRIVPTPAEKDELLRIGQSIEHDVADVMHVVVPTENSYSLRCNGLQNRLLVEKLPCEALIC